MTDAKRDIERLEHAFWQSMVDNEPRVAIGMLAERALMVSGHGAMAFDHAGYTKMQLDASHKLLEFELSDLDVLFPGDDVAIATYKVDQTVEYDGMRMNMRAVDSSTWLRSDAGWKCVAHTESLQPDPP